MPNKEIKDFLLSDLHSSHLLMDNFISYNNQWRFRIY